MDLEILREIYLLCAPKGKYTACLDQSICYGIYPVLSPSFFTFSRDSDLGWKTPFSYDELNQMSVEAALETVNRYNAHLRGVMEG